MAFWKIVLDGGRRLRPRLSRRPATTSTSAGGSSTAAGRSASTRPPWSGTTAARDCAPTCDSSAATAAARRSSRHATPSASPPTGTARWRGRIYNSLTPVARRAADLPRASTAPRAYQSVYRGGGHLLDLVHQVGVPIAAVLLLTAPLALISPWLALPALLALVGAARRSARSTWRARIRPATTPRGQAELPGAGRGAPPAPAARSLRGHAAATATRAPAELEHGRGPAAARCKQSGRESSSCPRTAPRGARGGAVDALRSARHPRHARRAAGRTTTRACCSRRCVYGELQTSSHPEGFVQVRIQPGRGGARSPAARARGRGGRR